MAQLSDLLLKKLSDGKLLRSEMFGSQDIDETLDARDAEPFDTEWMRVHDAIAAREPGRKETEAAKKVREFAFKRTYEATESPDLEGQVLGIRSTVD